MKDRGFTIVELLIVIVVIGILAAISIVAYTGVQGRALTASLTSDLDSAAKSLKLFQVDNGAYPTSLNCALADSAVNKCVKSSPNTTYQYVVDNVTQPQTFCITATSGTTSYAVTQAAQPASGDCADAALIGRWKFNGNAIDSVGSGHDGTVVGASLTTGRDGAGSGAYSFNGVDQYVNFGNSSAFSSSEITFATWVKTNTVTGYQNILAKEVQYKYRLSGTNLGILISDNGVGWDLNVTAPANFASNVWYHVALTISSSSRQVVAYVNGVQVGSYLLSGPITGFNGKNLYAATYNPGLEMLNGSLDDARIYNRALSAAEIQTIYTNPSS